MRDEHSQLTVFVVDPMEGIDEREKKSQIEVKDENKTISEEEDVEQ